MPSKAYHTPITGTPDIRTALNTALGELDTGIIANAPAGASFSQEYDDNTNGGIALATSWAGLRLFDGSEVDGSNILATGATTFTPASGTYALRVRHTFGGAAAGGRMRLYNTTQASVVQYGSCVRSVSGSQNPMSLMAVFTANGTDVYQVQYYSTALMATGLGAAHNIGTMETYGNFMMMRIKA